MQPPPFVRGEPDSERIADLPAQTPSFEILARRPPALRLPQEALVEGRRLLERQEQTGISIPPAGIDLPTLFEFECDSEPLAELFHGLRERQVLHPLDEADDVASLAAAEAIVETFVGAHGERGRLLFVERA